MQLALLDQLEVLLAARLRADAARHELREATTRVLLALGPAEAGLSMQALAKRLDRDPTTVTRFVDRAVAEGFVARQAGKKDRRRRVAALTPEGRVVWEALLASRRDRTRRLHDTFQEQTGLGAGQVEWFVSALIEALAATSTASPGDEAQA